MTQTPEPLRARAVVASRVREVREKRGRMSAQRLADEMAKVGVPWNRDIVANLENGRRQMLDVEELLALAYVLNVAPVNLVVPPDASSASYAVTPGPIEEDVTGVRDWFRGHRPLPEGADIRAFYAEAPVEEWGRVYVPPTDDIEDQLRGIDALHLMLEDARERLGRARRWFPQDGDDG